MKVEEIAAMPLAGGLAGRGHQCGQLWGATLAAGARAFQLFGPGAQAETLAVVAAQRLVRSFQKITRVVDCKDIIGVDLSSPTTRMIIRFFIRLGPVRCFTTAPRFAKAAYGEINAVLSDGQIETIPQPVSCASLVAGKMGASELHQVMAAGLAGGIGLSGNACGALGTAIWILMIKSLEKGTEKIDYQDPRAVEMIAAFKMNNANVVECSKLTGRKFENVKEHAAFLSGNGCSKIIDSFCTV